MDSLFYKFQRDALRPNPPRCDHDWELIIEDDATVTEQCICCGWFRYKVKNLTTVRYESPENPTAWTPCRDEDEQ